jgi:hypothetical protein
METCKYLGIPENTYKLVGQLTGFDWAGMGKSRMAVGVGQSFKGYGPQCRNHVFIDSGDKWVWVFPNLVDPRFLERETSKMNKPTLPYCPMPNSPSWDKVNNADHQGYLGMAVTSAPSRPRKAHAVRTGPKSVGQASSLSGVSTSKTTDTNKRHASSVDEDEPAAKKGAGKPAKASGNVSSYKDAKSKLTKKKEKEAKKASDRNKRRDWSSVDMGKSRAALFALCDVTPPHPRNRYGAVPGHSEEAMRVRSNLINFEGVDEIPPTYLCQTSIDTAECGRIYVDPDWDRWSLTRKCNWALGKVRSRGRSDTRTDYDMAHGLICDIISAEKGCILGYIPTWDDWADLLTRYGTSDTLDGPVVKQWFKDTFDSRAAPKTADVEALKACVRKVKSVPWNPDSVRRLSPSERLDPVKKIAVEAEIEKELGDRESFIARFRMRRFAFHGIIDLLQHQFVPRGWSAETHKTFVTPDEHEVFSVTDLSVDKTETGYYSTVEEAEEARKEIMSKTYSSSLTLRGGPSSSLSVAMPALSAGSTQASSSMGLAALSLGTGRPAPHQAASSSQGAAPEEMTMSSSNWGDQMDRNERRDIATEAAQAAQAHVDQLRASHVKHTQGLMACMAGLDDSTRAAVETSAQTNALMSCFGGHPRPSSEAAMQDPRGWLAMEASAQDQAFDIQRAALLSFTNERVSNYQTFAGSLIDRLDERESDIGRLNQEIATLKRESDQQKLDFQNKAAALVTREQSVDSSVYKANAEVRDLRLKLKEAQSSISWAKQRMSEFLFDGLKPKDPAKTTPFLVRQRVNLDCLLKPPQTHLDTFAGKKYLNGRAPQIRTVPIPVGEMFVDTCEESCSGFGTDRLTKMQQAVENASNMWNNVESVDDLPPLEIERFDTVPSVDSFFLVPEGEIVDVEKPGPSPASTKPRISFVMMDDD